MKFLLPVDGSSQALDAVAHCISLARQGLPVEVLLVNVQEPASTYEILTLHDADTLAEVTVAAGRDLMDSAVRLLQHSPVAFGETVRVGDVVPALLECLEEVGADAILLGGGGTGRVGGVTQHLLAQAPVPVTVVPAVSTTD